MSSANVGTLWTTPAQWKGKLIKTVAAYGNLKLDEPASYEHFVDNQKPEFLARFPHGKVPAFEGSNGLRLFEAFPISRYLASLAPQAGLLGNTSKETALVDQWMHLVETELDEPLEYISFLCNGTIAYSKPVHTFFLDQAKRALSTLEKHISSRTFFVSERLTLADLASATIVAKACTLILGPKERKMYPNLMRHTDTVLNQDLVKNVFGKIDYCDHALEFKPKGK